ncbi:hypothetical protein C8R44DRAFT_821813 [Mycena epipterygia]|nr:hypothetical protein C8R44DRAFT_821813 [Mycena epipterygia]
MSAPYYKPEIEQPPPAYDPGSAYIHPSSAIVFADTLNSNQGPDHYYSSQPQNHPQPNFLSSSTVEYTSFHHEHHEMGAPTNPILGCLCCPCACVMTLCICSCSLSA